MKNCSNPDAFDQVVGPPTAKIGRTRFALPDRTTAGRIRRTMNPAFLNLVANDATVREWLGGDGPIDMSALIVDPNNVAVESAHGGFLGVNQGFGRYEIHSFFLTAGRGTETMDAMQAGLDYLFANTDAVELVTKVPKANGAAAGLAIRAGFERRFTSTLEWTKGYRVEADFLSLSIDRWALRSTDADAYGHWFHEALAEAKRHEGSEAPVHADDSVHDRMVGATILMLSAGNVLKAAKFYNAWAQFAQYASIQLLSQQPAVLDIQDAIIEVRPSEMEILTCR